MISKPNLNSTTPLVASSNSSTLVVNATVAVLYCLFGLSAEFLAIPPDFATPVWPAAGISLGFTLVYGTKVLPGVFVGALLANTTIAYMQGNELNAMALLFASAIGFGAALQAWIARALLLVSKISIFEFKNGSEIVRFLLVIGPIGCLVNSLNGATMLCLFSIVSWDIWWTNWLTWWVGDTVGALVITPFVVRYFAKELHDGESHWQPLVISITFMILVILSFFYVRALEQDNRRNEIAKVGRTIENYFDSHIYEVKVVLSAIKSFYESSVFVDLKEFNHFAKNLMTQNSAIHAIEWLPYVKHEDRAATETNMREQGFANFSFTKREPSGVLSIAEEKPDYLPILYVYPYAPHEKIHGLDVLSLSYRENQCRTALTTGESFISSPLRLVQEREGQTAYILLSPVKGYQGEGYTGLVQVIFRVSELVEKSVTNKQLLAAFAISDVTNPNKKSIIFGQQHSDSPYTWKSEAQLLNRKLLMELHPTPELMKNASTWQSYSMLIGGLLYVAMLEAVLLSLLTRQRSIQSQVEHKTREIAQAKEAAEIANKSKTDFLASMSHELRTPLNAIIGFTRRVLSNKELHLDARNEDALRIVEKNALHLLGLINNLLDITRVEKGKLELELEEVKLRDLILEAKNQFSLAAGQKRTELVIDCQVEGKITADERRIRQVLMNLIANAIKFTSNGTITLKLCEKCPERYLKVPTDTPGYIIQIVDTGIGIAGDDLPKLFNRFQKVGNTAGLNPHGTGLGLALCKEIVDLHNGRIQVASDLGRGSTFSFWLPVNPSDIKTNV
ncbi:MAG: CHASE domain-containing protein [Pseudomonadales bacterium]|nr:CHASE domain-containing protein [Pseudomonadales bacterium]